MGVNIQKARLSQSEIDKIVVAARVFRKPTIYGVGSNDVDFYTSITGKHVWQFVCWKSLMLRGYAGNRELLHKAYIDVTVCDEWLSFGNFLEWANREVGYKGKPVGMALDKDILVRGNRVYAPDKCCFVPQAVNSLLTDSAAVRGEWPLGVHFNKARGRFGAVVNKGGRLSGLGFYDTPEDAFLAYKTAKEAQIKLVALQYKASLKPAVFESLMNWEIEP